MRGRRAAGTISMQQTVSKDDAYKAVFTAYAFAYASLAIGMLLSNLLTQEVLGLAALPFVLMHIPTRGIRRLRRRLDAWSRASLFLGLLATTSTALCWVVLMDQRDASQLIPLAVWLTASVSFLGLFLLIGFANVLDDFRGGYVLPGLSVLVGFLTATDFLLGSADRPLAYYLRVNEAGAAALGFIGALMGAVHFARQARQEREDSFMEVPDAQLATVVPARFEAPPLDQGDRLVLLEDRLLHGDISEATYLTLRRKYEGSTGMDKSDQH